jgi:glycosyltransferase involved in cell wall biosynthesis
MTDLSVIFPVFNNLAVAQVTLPLILEQDLPEGLSHEVVVVDDGSGPAMKAWLAGLDHPNLRLVTFQTNRGRSAARNAGVRASRGNAAICLDCDVSVLRDFVAQHARALGVTPGIDPSALRPLISVGRVIDTPRLGLPDAAARPKQPFWLPHFATANVGVVRDLLDRVQETPDGPFDEVNFIRYGWEDLELEQRLVQAGAKRANAGAAVAWHHCPPFSLDNLPGMLRKEVERAEMARVFLAKHPNLAVRLMTQMTPAHRALWLLFSLGGLLNERRMRPVLGWLVARGRTGLAETLARLTVLNPTYMRHL